ncbi:MAG: DnaJ C-terminal domain-containing protein [Pseudomonadota bacterium]
MDFKNYYQTLGVEKVAPPEDIKKAYRKLARKFHPDVSKESDATHRMKEINEAYAVLSDPEKRAAYDELGSHARADAPFEPPPGWHGGGSGESTAQDEMSDFFHNLFGRGAWRARQPPEFKMRGQDLHTSIEIELADAYQGAQRPLTISTQGADAHGQVTTEQRNLNVSIPKGVREGQHIRLKGQGGAGTGGAPAGDLYLEVHFKQDPRFRVEGHDVIQAVAVAPWEAVLGAEIEVATPAGRMQVQVPPDSQSGRKLRLKGRGLPADPPGNLILVLDVVLPRATTPARRTLYQTMAREMAFNPRENTT